MISTDRYKMGVLYEHNGCKNVRYLFIRGEYGEMNSTLTKTG